jgi:DNA-binding MarR family transcriptional regulator
LEIEIMNLRHADVGYFPVTADRLVPKDVPLFRAQYKSAVLAEINRHRARTSKAGHTLFTLPWHLPFEELSLRELLCITQLYRESFYTRTSFVIETKIADLGRHCGLARQTTSRALGELEDKKLIRMTRLMQDHKINDWGTRIELCDPEGSGMTLVQMADAFSVVAFETKTIEEWYSLLIYGEPGRVYRPKPCILIDPGDPAQMGRCADPYPCPLLRLKWVTKADGTEEQRWSPCQGVTSDDRRQLVIKFYENDTDGRSDSWHCFRCGQGGNCHSLYLRLWPKVRQRLFGRVYVGSYERAKEARQRAEFEKARAEIKAKARRVLEAYEQSRRTETTDH